MIDRVGLCIDYRVDEGFKSLNLHSVDYTDSVRTVLGFYLIYISSYY